MPDTHFYRPTFYRYDEFDRTLVSERVAQFRDQVERRLAGELTEDEFKPLRLMNGLYLQLHAYMLRIAIPYGTLSSRQLRKLAAHRAQLRPRLRPFHHAPEPAVQLAEARRTCRTSWPSWPRSRCTPSRPPATASATSPPTISPAPPPTRSPTRAPSRDHAPVVVAASGVHLPAAQVQDRGDRRAAATAPPSRCTTSACI